MALTSLNWRTKTSARGRTRGDLRRPPAWHRRCRTLLAAAQHAQEVATLAEAGLAGTLRIGVVTSARSEPLLSTLAAFRHARPRVDLQITEVDTPSGQQALLQHEIDLADIRPSTPVRGLRIQPWRHDEFGSRSRPATLSPPMPSAPSTWPAAPRGLT